MDEGLVKVNINIAGRSYPVKVTPLERLMIDGIEKDLNTLLQQLQKNYPTMDMQDCLGMAMIKLAFESKSDVTTKSIEKASRIQELLASVQLK